MVYVDVMMDPSGYDVGLIIGSMVAVGVAMFGLIRLYIKYFRKGGAK